MKHCLYLILLLAIGNTELFAQTPLILNAKTRTADTTVTLIPDCWRGFTKTNTGNIFSNPPDFTCGGGWNGTHSKVNGLLAVNESDCYYYNIHWPDSVCLYEKALTYSGIDPYMCRDSMRRYCELHPYATVSPGQTLNAFRYTFKSSGDIWWATPGNSNEPWVNEYNWFVKMQPINPDMLYQKYVINGLANCLSGIDWNEEANMWYNYTLLFPEDSVDVASCWHTINGIRERQSRVPEDTTPFHKLTFPLKPLENAVVLHGVSGNSSAITIISDPSGKAITVTYDLMYDGDADFAILDQLGRELVHKRTNYLAKGSQKMTLQLDGLGSGSYYLRLLTGSSVVTKPFLVIR